MRHCWNFEDYPAGGIRGDHRGNDGETLLHRGPDAGATFVERKPESRSGDRRLAILDLSERGAQPMHSACGRYVSMFNGEIYNHSSAREASSGSGAVAWRGTSDTETLLAGFVALGRCGDAEEGGRHVRPGAMGPRRAAPHAGARSFWREAALLRLRRGGRQAAFVFGSELKALRAHPAFDNPVDRGAVALVSAVLLRPTPYSIYENVFKLEPGTTLRSRPIRLPTRHRAPRDLLALCGPRGRRPRQPSDEREGLER